MKKQSLPEVHLLNAAFNGDSASARSLLAKQRIEPNAKDQFGLTALIYASMYGHVATARTLLEAGADLDAASSGHVFCHDFSLD